MRTVKDLPAPRQLPIVGVLPEFRRDALSLYKRMHRECGPVGKYRTLWFESFFVNEPDLIAEILVDQADAFEKNWFEMVLRPAMGVGLFLIDTDLHRQRRKLVAPAFQHRRIADYADTMVRLTREIVGGWRPGSSIELSEVMTTLTLRIVVRALFGTDMAGETNRVGDAVTDLVHDYTALFQDWIVLPASVPTPRNQRMKRDIQLLNETVEAIVEERRSSTEDHGDLLAMLLAS